MASPKTVCFNIDWAIATISDIDGIDVNEQDEDGRIPLHWAARHSNNPEIISTLLNKKYKKYKKVEDVVNARDNYDDTPLHRAALNNENPQIISTLLKKEYGADVNARNKSDWTPMHNVSRFGGDNTHIIITALKEAGASIEIKTDRGATPFDLLKKRQEEEKRNLSDIEKVILFDD